MKISSLILGAALLALPLQSWGAPVQPAVPDQTSADEVTLLTFHLTNGSIEQFNLPDKPVITFDGDIIDVKSETMEGQYNRADVDYYNFVTGERVVRIDDVTASTANFSLVFTDNATLTVEGDNLKNVSIADLNGRIAISAPASEAGKVTVDLSQLAPGVYIVTPSDHKSFKIIKK